MSILQSPALHHNTSAILQSLVHEKLDDVEWPGYVQARDQIEERQNVMEQALNRKRIEALKYLSKVRDFGDKYNKTESRVFTPDFVHELGMANSARRIQSNPWLEASIHGIDGDGAEIMSTHGNVLPFGPSIGVQTPSNAG